VLPLFPLEKPSCGNLTVVLLLVANPRNYLVNGVFAFLPRILLVFIVSALDPTYHTPLPDL
jgi:hypothetical protein